jgi:hypothetical protein
MVAGGGEGCDLNYDGDGWRTQHERNGAACRSSSQLADRLRIRSA